MSLYRAFALVAPEAFASWDVRAAISCKVCVSERPKINLAIIVDQAHNSFSQGKATARTHGETAGLVVLTLSDTRRRSSVRITSEGRRRVSFKSMSDEFDSLDANEKAGIGATLIRCRVLAAKNCERTP
jgi:hypothetical protein